MDNVDLRKKNSDNLQLRRHRNVFLKYVHSRQKCLWVTEVLLKVLVAVELGPFLATSRLDWQWACKAGRDRSSDPRDLEP